MTYRAALWSPGQSPSACVRPAASVSQAASAASALLPPPGPAAGLPQSGRHHLQPWLQLRPLLPLCLSVLPHRRSAASQHFAAPERLLPAPRPAGWQSELGTRDALLGLHQALPHHLYLAPTAPLHPNLAWARLAKRSPRAPPYCGRRHLTPLQQLHKSGHSAFQDPDRCTLVSARHSSQMFVERTWRGRRRRRRRKLSICMLRSLRRSNPHLIDKCKQMLMSCCLAWRPMHWLDRYNASLTVREDTE